MFGGLYWVAAERARGMCREVFFFYLAAFIIPNLPRCIIFSRWKQIFTSSIPPSGVAWVSHWLALVSHRSWTKYHTQLYCRDLFLYLSWLPGTGESLQVGGGRSLGLRESVPHHLLPCGMSLGNFSVWPPALGWSLDRAGLKFCKAPLPVCVVFFFPPLLTRALTLGFSWTFPASKRSLVAHWGTTDSLGFVLFKGDL